MLRDVLAGDATFVVRNDASRSEVVVQTSDTTWQAYNTWGGTSFYEGPNGRGQKVSYNRPWASSARDYIFGSEYPMIRFLERNGYDLSYISGLDTDRAGSLLSNHRLFLSSGHDEYWSGGQRANVEGARDAGVNLAFFSGNEVYWKTRWEPSIDGSGTANRTLVCYKETLSNAKIDPSPEWTGTWRDPRFSPPANGGRPENGLTGTAYMSNDTDLPVTVTAAEGRLRPWRNTAAAGLAAGTSLALAPHTVGYESDEDLDNGFRPAGLVRLSTTTGPAPQYLQDFGSTVAPGTTTHHLTMYRAPGGAKVFSTGTIQWAWGLDTYHEAPTAPQPVDVTMQQATLNVLADLGAQATTRMAGLVAASASADVSGPTVTVSSPAAGAAIPNGTTVTATGVASDLGGVVAGVEVSTDDGLSWHPATGTTSWSYTYVQRGSGATSVRVRATDDSLNTGAVASVAITSSCPCSLFSGVNPKRPDGGDASAVELGVRFTSSQAGWLTGVRFYKSSLNTGTHVGSLWSANGQLLAQGTFANETPSGWQQLQFPAPVQVTSGTAYVVSYFAPNGHYAADAQVFAAGAVSAAPLTAPGNTGTQPNGVYAVGHAFPGQGYAATWYGVDPVFTDKDTYPPVLVATAPVDNASSVPVGVAPSATYSEDVVPASAAMSLSAASGPAVAGSASYDAASRRVTFTPSAPLAADTSYVATVTGTDLAGNQMAPATFTFRTARPDQTPGVCPCSVWNDSATPSYPAYPDSSDVELGMRFSTDSDGVITGLRFYKGVGNGGVHTGSLWSATGQLLATATFTGESATGWQSVSFASPVTVTAGTTYLVSYHAPTGRYAVDINAFSAAGVNASPILVPRGAGAYRGGAGFPANASDSNYWVDPVFTVPAGTKPAVSAMVPAASSTSVPVSTTVAATFTIRVQAGSAAVTVTDPGGARVAGTTAYSATTNTATFTPAAALAAATTYQVVVSGALSMGGTAMDPVTTTFTTSGAAACPCTIFSSSATPTKVDSGDASALTVGVAFVPDTNGFVSAVRFYKAAANTGAHTGSLWSATGQRLATGTFTSESPTGWQVLTFAQPVDVVAGQRYVASYFAPNGHYSGDGAFFATTWTNSPLSAPTGGNGVFRYGADAFPTDTYNNANYWVDVVFRTGTAPDLTPPSITSRSPIAGASSVAASTAVSVVFSEAISPASLSLTLRDASGAAVAGTTAYDTTSRTATFTPTAALQRGATYSATVNATDTAGNPMTAPATWSFLTAYPDPAPGVCPCSLWTDATTPAVITVNDPAGIELGVSFRADVAGSVTGLRFYKGPQNTGTHTGTLWSAAGVSLATATFGAESSTGWQTVSFANPVAVTAGTTYVASYRTTTGYYSATVNGLAAAVDKPPLHADANGGRYLYGAGFPTSASATNYWVDPVFTASPAAPAADTTPPVISGAGAAATGSTATVTWTTDESATSVVSYGTTPALGLTASGASGTSHSVPLTGLASATTYYYRVTSADASGNSSTFPASASAPLTFTSPDTVAPVVTAIQASGTGTTATVTWTTDESSTSTVSYGTTTALGSSATGAAGTSHTVTLSGLTPNTRYYYRVTSSDAAANSTTSPSTSGAPAVYVPGVVPVTHSTVADFATGTGGYVSDTSGGEVTGALTLGTEFGGTTLPSNWTSTALVTGGATTLANGTATVSGARLRTNGAWAADRSFAAWATLSAGQSIGFGSVATGSTTVGASFTMDAAGALTASVNDGGLVNVVLPVPGTWTTGPHEYRVDWTTGTVAFLIDGAQVATSAFSPTVNLRVIAIDPAVDAVSLPIDWVRVTPYSASSTYTSAVLDAGAIVGWDTLSRDVVDASGSTVTVQVRSGPTSIPGTGWTGWTTVSATTGTITRSAQYLQYRLQYTSSGSRFVSSATRSVQIQFHVL